MIRKVSGAYNRAKAWTKKPSLAKLKDVHGLGKAVAPKVNAQGAIKKFGQSSVASFAGPARAGLNMLKKRSQEKRALAASQEFVDYALNLAESKGWAFDTDEDVVTYIDVFTEAYLDEMAVGMAPIGVIKMGSQVPGKDSFPGLDTINPDGQRVGPKTDTQSGTDVSAKMDKKADIDNKDMDKKQTRGPDSFPALSYARKDGQRSGPKAATMSAEEHHPVKAESLHDEIYYSLAGKRTRDMVNQGRNPSPVEIKSIAESEGFRFGNLQDVDNFMRLALVEKLFPSTGPTKHASQMKGDEFPGQSEKAMDIRGLKKAPKDGTTGQNRTGSGAAKDSGEAPHRPGYKKDGPKGATRQFEKSAMKVCPVCNQKNGATGAHCGACGAVLPAHPENRDGGVPANAPNTKKQRNHNVVSDGGTPAVASPYGGSKSKHYYLKKSPVGMNEDIRESQIPESPRMVIHDLLENYDNIEDYLDEDDIEESKRRALKAAIKRGLGRERRTKLKALKGLATGKVDNIAKALGTATGRRLGRKSSAPSRLAAKKLKKVGQKLTWAGDAMTDASRLQAKQRSAWGKMLPSKRGLGESAALSYAPQGVHNDALKMPSLAAVNAKAKTLGLNDITGDELNRVVGMYQQGETVGKVKLYTGVDVRLCQAIANMLGIGASHGMTRGMTDYVAPANLHPNG